MHGGMASGTQTAGDVVPDEVVPDGKEQAGGPLLRLADGVVPLVIADRPVLFIEATQRLNALNGSAGMLVALLADGIGLADLRHELHETMGMSAGEVDALVVAWSAQRVMAADFGPSDVQGHLVQLRAGGRDILVHFPEGAWGRELAAAYAHLPALDAAGAGAAEIDSAARVTVEAMGQGPDELAGIFDEQAGTLAARDAAAPVLRGAIVDLVLEQPGYVALHAACLVSPQGPDSGAVLLIGAPGAGKSTLATMAAVSAGPLGLAGDDIVLFDPRSGLVMGVPLPLTVKSGSWDRLAAVLPGLAALPPVLRADGQWLRYAPLPSPVAPAWQRVAAIVDLRREDGRAAGLIPQSPIDCLGRLLEEGFVREGRCTAAQMRGLARMVDNADTCTLHYAEAEAALPMIEALLA